MKIKLMCGIIWSMAGSIAMGDGFAADESDASVRSGSSNLTTEIATTRHLDFYASDKAAQIRYERDSSVVSVDNGRVTIGFLFDEERDNIFTGGLVADSTPVFLPGVRFSFGGKVYAALLGVENSDVFGIGMGIEAAYDLPLQQFPLHLEAAVYYSPDILSFGQADRIIDWEVNAGLRLRKTITGYIGFRFLQFDTRPGDRKPDNGVHVGIRWNMLP